MRLSTFGVVKDFLFFGLLIATILVGVQVIIPRMKTAQEEILSRHLVVDQKSVIRNEVRSIVDTPEPPELGLARRQSRNYTFSTSSENNYQGRDSTVCGARAGLHPERETHIFRRSI